MTGASVKPMRPGLGSAAFLAVMLGASALTMIRVAVLAGLLPMAQFAMYATIVATGAFLSTIISFGAVEQTIKAFPRLMEMGRADLLRAEAWRIFLMLAKRAGILGGIALLIGYLSGSLWVEQLGLAALYSLSTASMALLASMQRAKADSVSLASGTLFRTATIFLFVVVAAFGGCGITVVLVTEVVATAVVCMGSIRLFFPADRSTDRRPALRPVASQADGLAVFAAFSAINVPFYLDRLYVVVVMGQVRAGQYAVLALFLTAASLLVNTVAQRIGPDAIRLVHRDGNARAALRLILVWIALIGLVWLCTMAVLAVIFSADLLPPAFARYRIDAALLAPIAACGLLLNSALLEFLLIALDRERALLRCTLIFLTAVLLAAAIIAVAGLDLVALIWALALCRLLYVGALWRALANPGGAMIARMPTTGQTL